MRYDQAIMKALPQLHLMAAFWPGEKMGDMGTLMFGVVYKIFQYS
ncbi:MAG: hypothetical protein SVZ03_03845 [Spirochaetota bacterium]|nr:hypothetical protein [Spirochaetota bacterium]